MKPLLNKVAFLIITSLFISISIMAQAPNGFNYQGVARNASGNPIVSSTISLRLSIRDATASGIIQYQETHSVVTNSFGIFSAQVGTGSVVSGSFAGITWGSGSKYLQVEMDPTGGTSYIAMGANQLLSVPYALYANSTGTPAWSLTGNTGTNPSTNFIGTRDSQDLVFKRNNNIAGLISAYNTSFGDSSLQASTGQYNTAIGSYALRFNTTGFSNTALGMQANTLNTTGYDNTAIGTAALHSNTTGYDNTAIGSGSLYDNITGDNNTATGGQSLSENTTGEENTANGAYALSNNTIGSRNTAIGYYTSTFSTSGNENTACGYSALNRTNTGSYNVAIGANALNDNNTGSYNVAIGKSALNRNRNQSNLVAIGDSALYNNISGYFNTAIGSRALYNNYVGTGNTAIGYSSLKSNNGYDNTATGTEALYSNLSGSGNNAYGVFTMRGNTSGNNNTAFGNSSLLINTTGNYNTAFGNATLNNNVTGSNNTGLGYNTDVSTGALNNATVVGYNASVNSSNKIRLGNTGVTVIEGQVAYSFPSDKRFKFNIDEQAVKGLDFIMKLKPVNYQFDTKKFDQHLMQNMPDSIQQKRMKDQNYIESSNIVHTGFLAQDVEQAAKEAGYTFDGVHTPTSKEDNYSVAYSQFVVPLVKAVQEQQQVIDIQNERIKTLENALFIIQQKLK